MNDSFCKPQSLDGEGAESPVSMCVSSLYACCIVLYTLVSFKACSCPFSRKSQMLNMRVKTSIAQVTACHHHHVSLLAYTAGCQLLVTVCLSTSLLVCFALLTGSLPTSDPQRFLDQNSRSCLSS